VLAQTRVLMRLGSPNRTIVLSSRNRQWLPRDLRQALAPLELTRQSIASCGLDSQPALGYSKMSAGGAPFTAPVPANRGYLCKMQLGPQQAARTV